MSSRPFAYHGNDPYVFISYAHADAETIYPIITELQQGLRVWYDQGIEVGSNWSQIIAQHLMDCTGTICFVTPAFLESENCLDEIFFAKDEHKHLMIVYLEHMKLPPDFRLRYGRFHALNLQQFSDTDALIQEILNTGMLQSCRREEPPRRDAVSVPPAPRKKEPTTEDIFQQGLDAYQEENYETAVPLFQKAADLGHGPAQYYLAECYYHSHGVEEDLDTAFRWYKAAAEQNYPPALFQMGKRYQIGNGVTQDESEAFRLFELAAKQGYPPALVRIADCYLEGKGVAENKTEAFRLFKAAAEQGNAEGQYQVGLCYAQGHGTKTDCNEAIHWYRKAAAQGHGDTSYLLGIHYLLGVTVPQSDSLASQYLEVAAKAESIFYTMWDDILSYDLPPLSGEECLRRANMAFLLYTVEDHSQIEFDWYKRAADFGSAEGQRKLGECYEFGMGVKKNLSRAVQLYRKAAEQGDAEGQYRLGSCYYFGSGVETNEQEALAWYRRAAEQGSARAMHSLGSYYEYRNRSESIKWHSKGAEAGDPSSQKYIGSAYMNGSGVKRDYEKAVYWLQKAADQRYPCNDDLEKAKQLLAKSQNSSRKKR